MFQRILIANRGEIALRVIRACRELGVDTAVVYSEADRDAPWLKLADRAICIGPAPSTESYLNVARVIAAAEVADVQAIHPGYGFLAENADFAEVCRSCNIEFIGPHHDAMRALGTKAGARALAAKAKVNTFPGSEGPVGSEKEAIQVAHEIGFPVMVKASAGGGGRGMRMVHNDMSLKNALAQARAEAAAAFKDDAIIIEKFVENARHIEVQMMADLHGNAVHLWERECSLQRRRQKLLEETPAPGLPASVREDICKAAVRLITQAKYTNAGTVEFLVDNEFRYYLLEVNARIQVEHPVTELVTGTDLVKEQIRVASGLPLPWNQQQIPQNGAAIECRINAEDPRNNFRPSAGTITALEFPSGPGVRWDGWIQPGCTVSPHYDSLLGKLIVHRSTRERAIACMRRALREFHIEGIQTTIPFHQHILRNSRFLQGEVHTEFIDRDWNNGN